MELGGGLLTFCYFDVSICPGLLLPGPALLPHLRWSRFGSGGSSECGLRWRRSTFGVGFGVDMRACVSSSAGSSLVPIAHTNHRVGCFAPLQVHCSASGALHDRTGVPAWPGPWRAIASVVARDAP